MELKPEPLKGKRFQEDGPTQGYTPHSEGNLLNVDNVKAGIMFYIDQVGKRVNDKGKLKSCDILELIKLSFPDLITDKDLDCKDNALPPDHSTGFRKEAQPPQHKIDSERFVRYMQEVQMLKDALYDLTEQTKGTNALLIRIREESKDGREAVITALQDIRQEIKEG